jgi:hypothetical protein
MKSTLHIGHFFNILTFDNRVNRLGDFLPIGRLFILGSFLENYESSQNLWALSPHLLLILTKTVWATFWTIFSRTHLVTLFNSLNFDGVSPTQTRKNDGTRDRHVRNCFFRPVDFSMKCVIKNKCGRKFRNLSFGVDFGNQFCLRTCFRK